MRTLPSHWGEGQGKGKRRERPSRASDYSLNCRTGRVLRRSRISGKIAMKLLTLVLLVLFAACIVMAARLPSFQKQVLTDKYFCDGINAGDLNRDGKPEIVAHWEDQRGFIQPDWSDPTRPWTFKPITDKRKWEQFYHGTGVGDVNGDGRRCRYKWNVTTKHAKHTKRIRRRACDSSQTPNSTGGN